MGPEYTRKYRFAEIVLAPPVGGVIIELFVEGLRADGVISHRYERHSGGSGYRRRFFRFFLESGDLPVVVDDKHAELTRLFYGYRGRGDGRVSVLLLVVGDHLGDVHLVDVVAAEDAHDVGILFLDE